MTAVLSPAALARTGAALFALASAACAEESGRPKLAYPNAEKGEAVDQYHGEAIADPYQWMEDGASPGLAPWLSAQQALTEAYVQAGGVTRIEARLRALESYEGRSAPVRTPAGYFYSTWPSIATDRSTVRLRDGDGAERVLLSPPFHYGEDADPDLIRFNAFTPSLEGEILAYTTSGDGSNWYDVRFLDVTSGALLSDELTGVHGTSPTLAWRPGGRHVYYVRFEKSSSRVAAAGRVFEHEIGGAPGEDKLVFAPASPELLPSIAASRDGAHLIISVFDPNSGANDILITRADRLGGEVLAPFSGRAATYAYLDNEGEEFWFFTNDGAPNGKVVRINIATGDQATVVAESAEPMSGGSLVGGNGVGKFGDRFVVLYMKDGSPLIRIFGLDGKLVREVELPPGGSVWGGFVGFPDSAEVYFRFLSMFSPATVFKMDARTGDYAPSSRTEIKGLDPDAFVVEKVFYESFDGTRVPMFISYKKGLKRDGTAPGFLYGYGAFGWNSFLFYQSHLIAWLEQGGVYAQPSLRGGGEYGEAWHDAGKGANKENTVGDYIASAEWLIDNRYVNPDSLVVTGGSASSMPAEATMRRRPDFFGAGVFYNPVLDLLRFSRFTQGKLWIDEFGSPEAREGFEALRRLSPYHNISDGACYPPTLVMVGEVDPVAPPLHGYKYLARLQAAQSCANPALLYVIPNGGHNFGPTPEQAVKSRAAMLAFLTRALGLKAR